MADKPILPGENPYPIDLRTLGARICLRRVTMGLTQRDLVNELYYERLLSDVEIGLVAPSRDYLEYLANCLETTPEELLGEVTATSAELTSASPENLEATSQEIALMNAHTRVETDQPAAALTFLQQLEPDGLTVDLKAVFYRVRGHALLYLRRYQEAEPDLEKALALLEEFFPTHFSQIEIVRNIIATNFHRQNRIKEALKCHQQCLEAVVQGHVTNPHFRLMLYSNLATEYYLLGNADLALNIYKKDALPLAEEGEDDSLVAGIFWGAALTFRDNGDLGQAVLFMDRSVKLYQKLQAWGDAVQAQDQLGLILIERKDYKLAEKVLLEALSLAETLNEPRALAFINTNIAYLYQRCNEDNKALGYIETAIKFGRELGDKLQLGQALGTLADIKLALNEPESAFEVYEEAIDVLDQTDQVTIMERIMKSYANALKQQGNIEKALEIRFKMRKLA